MQKDWSRGAPQHVRVNHLTTVHADLLQLSLSSCNLTLALDLLSHDILDIQKPANSSFDSKYYLSYFYYAACVHGSLKQFETGLFYLEQALTVPATVISQIMVEAYKKLILFSLISKGKIPALPKYTSRIVVNQIKPICEMYHELAQVFVNSDMVSLNVLCNMYQESFERDGNSGLVKQVKQAFVKNSIQKLTKTFITLSLSDMASKVKLGSASQAQDYMQNMIKDGEIFATINQKDGKFGLHFLIL